MIRFVFTVLCIFLPLALLLGWVAMISGIPLIVLLPIWIFLSGLASVTLILFSNKSAGTLPTFLYRVGRTTRSRREQLSAEVEKARYSMREGRFDQALGLVNSILRQEPDYPEVLYLKARILREGFGNSVAAKNLLKRLVSSVSDDGPLNHWPSAYLEEIIRTEKTGPPDSSQGLREKRGSLAN